jgi:hypothetical protein
MHRIYIYTSALFAAIFAFCIVTFCFVIDPYAIYPTLGTHESDENIDLFYHLRLNKPYAMENIRPRHLIVGSSRSARLPPGPFASAGENAYNASLPGVTMREMRRMVEHADSIASLQSVFIGVDFYMFRKGHSELDDHYDDARLRKPNASVADKVVHRMQRFEDNWSSLFSVDALLSAFEAISEKHTSQRIYHRDGTWEAVIARQKSSRHVYSMLARQTYDDFMTQTDELDITEFDRLLDFCENAGIRTTVFISPFHASIMNAVDFSGKWQRYLTWQRQLTDAVERSGADIRLLAVESNSNAVLESMDAGIPFFQDGVHYTAGGGESVIACLTNDDCSDDLQLTVLGRSNIEDYLSSVDRTMKGYKETNTADYKLLLKWIKNAAKVTKTGGAVGT